MNDMNDLTDIFALPQYGVVQVSGPDTQAFLQGQVTNDVHKLANHTASFGACCDHKGRMITNFLMYQNGNDILLIMASNNIDIFLQHIKKYAAFSKVELQALKNLNVYGSFTHASDQQQHPIQLSTNQYFYINDHDISTITMSTEKYNLWNSELIKHRIVFIDKHLTNLFTPQMIALQKLGGVSFDKGCYVGQEVVARTEHLGKLKRHLYLLESHRINETLNPGDSIVNQKNETMGIITSYYHESDKTFLLAVMQDRAKSEKCFINDNEVIYTDH